MKLGASVYVPTEQFLATIINRSRGCGRTGRGLPRIMGQKQPNHLQVVSGSHFYRVRIAPASQLTGRRGSNNPGRGGAYTMKCVREKWYQRGILCEQYS